MDHDGEGDDPGQSPQTVAQARQQVRELRDLLRQGAEVRVHPNTQRGDVTVLGWLEYPDGVWYGLWACHEIAGPDPVYLDHIDAVRNKPFESLSISEIGTFLTFLVRGERFCDGLIASALEDGTCLALVERLAEWLGIDPGV